MCHKCHLKFSESGNFSGNLRKSEEMQKFLKIWIVRKNTKKRAKEIWNPQMWRISEEIWENLQNFKAMMMIYTYVVGVAFWLLIVIEYAPI